MTETLGYIGLGQMGLPMTLNLLRAGYPCVVNDTNAGAVRQATDAGATAAATAREVAEQTDVIFTCLPNGNVVWDVVTDEADGVLAGTGPGKLYIDMSTNYPPWSIELAGRFAEKGAQMLDAPISGGDVAAQEGKLSIMVGGPAEAFERARPLFDILGQRATHMGESGAGGYTKLANQIMYAINLIGVVESLTFARKAGLDLPKVIEALSAGIANSRVLEVKAPKVLARDFSVQGPVWMLRKDLTYITRAMEDLEANLPISPSLLQYYVELDESGKTNVDQLSVMELFERMAGLEEK